MFLALASTPHARIITVDPCNHPWSNEYDKAGFKLINDTIDQRVLDTGKVKQWVMTSQQASFEWIEQEMPEIDFLFVDGLHEDCENDIKYWLPHVKNGGLIAFHDFDDDHPEVKNPVEQACLDGRMMMLEAKAWMCIC